ncbi:MAG TPA: PEP-utilizing enzyme, partial [Caldisericia bacterium]|nr:PEP-utilizing enzyme [Caldisericia bacterium]
RSHTNNVSSWPILFDSRGTCFNPLQETQKGEIIGNPISPGVVQGSVKVMHQPFEKKLESGEILVTASTEPSWTPIFMNARGVVMEIGGILQHGAIIAREYGIPCVAGINNATQWLRDGDVIVVDGSRGTVRKISPEEKL